MSQYNYINNNNHIKDKSKLLGNNIFLPEKANFSLFGDFNNITRFNHYAISKSNNVTIHKTMKCPFWFYIFIYYILIVTFFYIIFCLSEKLVISIKEKMKYKYNKMQFNEATKIKKFIKVQNTENEPSTIAEVIIQNKINYIPKVSIIIPVYNDELYLKEYLDSLINQTLKNIEIIFIDDGSTDNSLYFLKKYAKKDKRITIIKQENLHSGNARNAGLVVAKGEYLSFLDLDNFFEFNMLEEMYTKIKKEQSDIVICQSKAFNSKIGFLDEEETYYSLKLDLIPKKATFSVLDIPKNIFEFCQGWTWDKLFRTNFILKNNIKFQKLSYGNDAQFTYTSLCFAKSITTLQKVLISKRNQYNKLFSPKIMTSSTCFLLSIEKIKDNLERKGLYNIVKESFWEWSISLFIKQLKTLDKNSKEFLFTALHDKFNIWDYIDNSPESSNNYRALHYIKYQKIFPTINIAYIVNEKVLELCLVSIISLLQNSVYENINIILLYSDLNHEELGKVIKLQKIRSFALQTFNISNSQYNNFPLVLTKKQEWYRFILADIFPNIDKILYLDCDTIVRKSLLPLWEININNKHIASIEDISKNNNKTKKINLKDNFFFNAGILLLNAKEWRKQKLYSKIVSYLKNNQIDQATQGVLNFLNDMKKTLLNPEFYYIEDSWKDKICQGDLEYLKLYNNNNYSIVHFKDIKPHMLNCKNSFKNEFLIYDSFLHNLIEKSLTIPIIISSNDNYAPFIYTTMVSILENSGKNTYYDFFLLVTSSFLQKNKNIIMELKNKYKCDIHFMHIKNEIVNVPIHFSFNKAPTYYRLLAGILLPKEYNKCIYLDVDICVCKDLSELFNIDLKDNYIAGVVAPGYYFYENINCKRLNLSSMRQYVNAGMLIMNLKKIREDNITKKFIELLKKNYSSRDQDILNVACYGKILTLPPKYNVMVQRIKENNPLLKNLYKEKDILEAKISPHIVHYCLAKKPWKNLGIYMEEYWWNIAKKTPYIHSLFKRNNIFKNELKNWWLKKKKKKLNLDNPITFIEKIQWLKIYDSTPIKTLLTDKYLVRDWVSEKIGEEYLIPLLGVYDKLKDINFDKLPNQFVIKCNHARENNIIVKDKSKLNLIDTKEKLNKWMNANNDFEIDLELHYRDFLPKIIIEKYMNANNVDSNDYKFICFNGHPKFLWAGSYKDTEQKRYIYDLNRKRFIYKVNPNYPAFTSKSKPKNLKKMVELASILSEGFAYVRVDFYMIKGKIYFVGMTFTADNGTEEFIPKSFVKRLASLIKFPKLIYDVDTGEYHYLQKQSKTKVYSFLPYYLFLFILFFRLFLDLCKENIKTILIKNKLF